MVVVAACPSVDVSLARIARLVGGVWDVLGGFGRSGVPSRCWRVAVSWDWKPDHGTGAVACVAWLRRTPQDVGVDCPLPVPGCAKTPRRLPGFPVPSFLTLPDSRDARVCIARRSGWRSGRVYGRRRGPERLFCVRLFGVRQIFLHRVGAGRPRGFGVRGLPASSFFIGVISRRHGAHGVG